MDGRAHAHTRERLEGELRRSIPDQMWDDLVDRLYVKDAESRDGWNDLAGEARRSFMYMDLGAAGTTRNRPTSAVGSTPVRARGEAFSALIARLVTEQSSNLRLVRGWWGGELLAPDEAVAHVESVAWRRVWVEDLLAAPGRSTSVAIGRARVRHLNAKVIGEVVDHKPGGRVRRVVHRTVELEGDGEDQRIEYEERSDSQVTVPITTSAAETLRLGASYHSLIGKLGELATELSWDTPWTPGQAAWFALTGETPYVPPIDVRRTRSKGIGHERDLVFLAVEPWVPFREVASAYGREQHEALGKANRPIRERSTELTRFLATEGWGLPVRDQMRRWNDLHPGWAEADPRNFRSRAVRVIDQVRHPGGSATDEESSSRDPVPD